MSNSWIKLHRQLTDWEWYTDSQAVHLFVHLIFKANYKPSKWRGIDIGIGQVVTGRKKLSKETGISERSIRTILNRLKSTSELTIKPTNRFSIITICNYRKFQIQDDLTDQLNDQPDANNRPATDQQPTTSKKLRKKEGKEEKRKPTVSCSEPGGSNESKPKKYTDSFEKFWKAYPPTRKGSKWKAFKSWQLIGRQGLATVPEIMAALEAQKQADHWISGKGDDFTPNAVTWLNGRRWEDEMSESGAQDPPSWDELMGGVQQ